MVFSRLRIFDASCILLSVLWSGTCTVGHAQATGTGKRLLAYYYGMGVSEPYKVKDIPFDSVKFTHIMHAFLSVKADGTLDVHPKLLEPDLIDRARKAKVKVLISVGGADAAQAQNFSTFSAKEDSRQTFVKEVVAFITKHGYDGVDIDWEVPETPDDAKNYISLMGDLRKELDRVGAIVNKRLLLSLAVTANPELYGIGFKDADPNYVDQPLKRIADAVDFMNVMTYDLHVCQDGDWVHVGHNSPLNSNPKDETSNSASLVASMDLFTKWHVDPQKLNFGTAFYGRRFNGVTEFGAKYSKADCKDLSYQEVEALRNSDGWKMMRDPGPGGAPYLVHANPPAFITYDDAESITKKVQVVIGERHMGGMFAWRLGHDYDGKTQELMSATYCAWLGDAARTERQCANNKEK